MNILLPYFSFTLFSGKTAFARSLLTNPSISSSIGYVYPGAENEWYFYAINMNNMDMASSPTVELAMKAFDSFLIKRKYILCNTEEQVNKYRLLL